MTEEKETKDELIQRGVIDGVLPRAMYQVRLEDGRRVRVGLPGPSRHALVRLIEGNAVEIKLSPHDPSRGQIVRKL